MYDKGSQIACHVARHLTKALPSRRVASIVFSQSLGSADQIHIEVVQVGPGDSRSAKSWYCDFLTPASDVTVSPGPSALTQMYHLGSVGEVRPVQICDFQPMIATHASLVDAPNPTPADAVQAIQTASSDWMVILDWQYLTPFHAAVQLSREETDSSSQSQYAVR